MPEHPHTEATYKLIPQTDGTFAVEVAIPDTRPAKVSGFDTQDKAERGLSGIKQTLRPGH